MNDEDMIYVKEGIYESDTKNYQILTMKAVGSVEVQMQLDQTIGGSLHKPVIKKLSFG